MTFSNGVGSDTVVNANSSGVSNTDEDSGEKERNTLERWLRPRGQREGGRQGKTTGDKH